MPQITRRYKKTQVLAGTAYTQQEYSNLPRYEYEFIHTSEIVIGKQNDIVKCRNDVQSIVETYLIVNSSPVLRHLVALYNKVFNIISKG